MSSIRRIVAAAVAATAWAAAPASAQTTMTLTPDPQSALAKCCATAFPIHGFSWAVTRAVEDRTGSTGVGHGPATLSTIVVRRTADANSPWLFEAVTKGLHFDGAVINAGFYRLCLGTTWIEQVAVDDDGSGPRETLSISPASVAIAVNKVVRSFSFVENRPDPELTCKPQKG